jgi:DNA-binding transcriptional LysR family regulator
MRVSLLHTGKSTTWRRIVVSAAGRTLGQAQSAISQAVATLEAIQGVTLFDRSGFRPTLTDMGRVLVGQARSVLSGAARFEALAAGARVGLEPELAVSIDPLVPTAVFIDSLHALRAELPYLPVSFFTEGLGGVERRPGRGDAALALCNMLPAAAPDGPSYGVIGTRPWRFVELGRRLDCLLAAWAGAECPKTLWHRTWPTAVSSP